ncbi:EAL domain-containing protein [Roseomonas stagni]|uniref:EAL domain-containing protein n=1 Tax=Falsiroseomonas algicola TaxID=2716930 RepID=A0A6M1LQB4_9PROT|nr:EAL domain-containing protein [Falsiroseomonas algicola]NGM22377.1 EAL domain-containing protein [Falsiroseomonas algicola]
MSEAIEQRRMPGGMAAEPSAGDAALVRLVTGFAAGIAMLVAVALPVMHVWTELREENAAMEAEARIVAYTVSQIASRDPDLWRFQAARLRAALATATPEADVTMRVRDVNGDTLAAIEAPLRGPLHGASAPIFENGQPVGTVEIEHSGLHLLVQSVWVTLASLFLAGGSYVALRLLPLRMLRRATSRITHLATHDQLTGLPNRRLFHDRLEQTAAGLKRYGGHFAVLALDLDRFKEVNDTLGHAAGDELLRQVAKRITDAMRESDTLARLGGDEFAIIQRSAEQPKAAEALAARLVELLSQPFILHGNQAMIGTSIGIALSVESAPDHLLQDADTALYRAKAEGRNGFRFFSAEMNQALRERRALEQDLREAMATGQLHLHYQPQVNLSTGRVIGLEALLRWDHPVRGRVMPDRFIPLAEEIGLLSRIGEWVLREACAVATRWPGLRMAVNISAHQFQAADFLRAVRTALEETGLPPARLEIEITEGVLLTDTERTLATLEALHALGVSVAMDDFGTGYSSLGYLHKFRFDKIKIDRSFVATLTDDPQAVAIVRAMIGITHALGLRCNAEGVENAVQAALLRAEGCTEAQGYLYGRAVPETELAALIESAGGPQAEAVAPPAAGEAPYTPPNPARVIQ